MKHTDLTTLLPGRGAWQGLHLASTHMQLPPPLAAQRARRAQRARQLVVLLDAHIPVVGPIGSPKGAADRSQLNRRPPRGKPRSDASALARSRRVPHATSTKLGLHWMVSTSSSGCVRGGFSSGVALSSGLQRSRNWG
jgi:hypothetical protein